MLDTCLICNDQNIVKFEGKGDMFSVRCVSCSTELHIAKLLLEYLNEDNLKWSFLKQWIIARNMKGERVDIKDKIVSLLEINSYLQKEFKDKDIGLFECGCAEDHEIVFKVDKRQLHVTIEFCDTNAMPVPVYERLVKYEVSRWLRDEKTGHLVLSRSGVSHLDN